MILKLRVYSLYTVWKLKTDENNRSSKIGLMNNYDIEQYLSYDQ